MLNVEVPVVIVSKMDFIYMKSEDKLYYKVIQLCIIPKL